MEKERPLIGEEKPVEGYIKKWSEHARPIIKQVEKVEKRESKVVAFNLFRATRELVKQMKP